MGSGDGDRGVCGRRGARPSRRSKPDALLEHSHRRGGPGAGRVGGFIGVGWEPVGNVADLTRDEVRARVDQAYPDARSNACAQWTGSLYRFANEMADGELGADLAEGHQASLGGSRTA